jgi:1-pyrroline-5-carboxylate dehydrogenase
VDAITTPPAPVNDPVRNYAPGSPERDDLTAALATFADARELPAVIGGRVALAGGTRFDVTAPHDHARVLGTSAHATAADTSAAIDAAMAAAPAWRELSFDDRAAVILKAADLLTGPWRARMNAATMLGQAKTAYQAEIDAACELADFWRFNVHFARQIIAEQPIANAPGIWNRSDHRPLEGFVYAITPFNFTAIAGNLPTAPALMGNVVLWKPSMTQQLAASVTMDLLRAAGLPDGVINLLPGDGLAVSEVALADPRLAGIHFTGSTKTFQHLWAEVGTNIARYDSYPRLVGETGGKDFILAHPSADIDILRTAIVRGSFEYSGQKCSASSRVFVPRSLWGKLRDDLAAETEALSIGDVEDFRNFTSAVIDERSFDKNAAAIDRAHKTSGIEVLAGGTYDKSHGYFVRPTIFVGEDPMDEIFSTEYFGPIASTFVYDDSDSAAFESIVRVIDKGSRYALTGSIIAADRQAALSESS